ncbi:hypothetical protein G5V59_02955 [Nocardioides sp. W3-2-3]|uniref:hypothetical protein n=1 Tax=Nocardioides convexus TaxID=2712224 RepID=UPI00241854B1|nr:hypothetical protein [Nocardioides convexus]NGZ99696.1 hypothetical protein [Nocardioides convexus]
MASRRSRPGRNLVIFFLALAVLYGLTALSQSGGDKDKTPWKPALGLDLQGGTRITLSAEKDQTKENLDEARRIIDQRVNGSGVAEAAVTTQGSRNIVVEVPGKTKDRGQARGHGQAPGAAALPPRRLLGPEAGRVRLRRRDRTARLRHRLDGRRPGPARPGPLRG